MNDLSRGGAGVAKDPSGRVVFIPFTAPGDLVEARILYDPRTKKNYAQAELVRVIEPGPERVNAPCPLFTRCGGCQWQHLPYELQWATKAAGVKHALQRTQVELPQHWEELPAKKVWEYRNRIQLRGQDGQMGFYAQRSHDLIPADRCEIARPEINAQWSQTLEQAKALPADRPFKVEVEVLSDGQIRRTWNSAHGASGFRQVHDDQNELMRQWVFNALPHSLPLFDLYGGSGNLSELFFGQAPRIDVVDVGSPNLRPAGVPESVHFHRSPALLWLMKTLNQKGLKSNRPKKGAELEETVAILDPPREGLAQDGHEIMTSLEAFGVRQAVLVGCDVDSWARDLSRFQKRGWKLERVAVLDLFPQTPHIESLALLKAPRF